MWPCYFGVSRFTDSLRPAELLAPLADLTGHSLPSQQGLLPPSFRPSRSPSSPSDISTVASGHLHRQDFHLLERQLASLHRHTYMDRSRAQDCFWSPMSDDPVAVIYSASLWGIIFVPRAQMEVRAPSPNHTDGLEGLCVAQVREGAGSDRFAI